MRKTHPQAKTRACAGLFWWTGGGGTDVHSDGATSPGILRLDQAG